MKLIWFNPEDRSYKEGVKVDYEVQISRSNKKNEFMIVHRFEDNIAHLSSKIVNRLNRAYQNY